MRGKIFYNELTYLCSFWWPRRYQRTILCYTHHNSLPYRLLWEWQDRRLSGRDPQSKWQWEHQEDTVQLPDELTEVCMYVFHYISFHFIWRIGGCRAPSEGIAGHQHMKPSFCAKTRLFRTWIAMSLARYALARSHPAMLVCIYKELMFLYTYMQMIKSTYGLLTETVLSSQLTNNGQKDDLHMYKGKIDHVSNL